MTVLREVACRYRADELLPEDLPTAAAEALAAGLDTPALCDLAGRSRRTDPRDIRELFEETLREAGVDLPPLPQARRHALRRMAARVAAREVAPAALASDDWWETETGTPEEEALVALLPSCGCCAGWSIGVDVRTWEAGVRAAALALARATPPPAGC